MTDALVLAIDIGTSAVRSAAVDGGGVIVASTRVTRPDASAGTRFDAERLWLDVVQSVVSLPASARARISTLAIAGHVGTVFVDADGAPVGEGRGWADSSGIELLTAAAGDSLAELLAAAGRTTPAGGAGSALLALRRSDPAAAASVARVLTPKDFVIWRFTRAAVTDRTSAAYSGLSAIADSTWSPRMLELVGLDPAQLPEQFAADEIVGELASEVADELGLNRGVAVAAGATDGSVGAALVLRDRQGVVADVAGTTDVLVRLVASPGDAPTGAVINPYPLGGFSAGGPTGATGAAFARWAVLLGFADVADATSFLAARLEAIGPGADGLLIDPSLSGARFPHWRPERTGMVIGQREDHGREHVLLAAAEGAAHIVRDAVDALDPSGAATLVLAGGVARSPELARLRADVLGRPIEVCQQPDVSLLGAALIALRGAGADVSAFGAHERRETVHPDPARAEQYAALHATWRSSLGFD